MKGKSERRKVLQMEKRVVRVNILEGGRIIEIFTVSDDENCQEEKVTKNEMPEVINWNIDEMFPIVKASTLSASDDFIAKYEPKTVLQEKFKNELLEAIKSGLTDFRAQRMDPCFDEKTKKVYYIKNGFPAIGKTPMEWKEIAEKVCPERRSRLGTKKQRVAFLGLLIKYLIREKNYTVVQAWNEVCNRSNKLAHYKDSPNAKKYLEPTGSRTVGEWSDLGNTCKIILNDEEDGFEFVGASFLNHSTTYPLTDFGRVNFPNEVRGECVAWIVTDCDVIEEIA